MDKIDNGTRVQDQSGNLGTVTGWHDTGNGASVQVRWDRTGREQWVSPANISKA